MTGDDQPRPGTSMAHFTFSVLDHVRGSAGASATPLADGPRKPGQFEVGAADTEATAAIRPMAAARTIDPRNVMAKTLSQVRVRLRTIPGPGTRISSLHARTSPVLPESRQDRPA